MQTLLLLVILSFAISLFLMPLVWVIAGRAMKIEHPALNYKSQFLNALLIMVLLQIVPNTAYVVPVVYLVVVTFLLKSGLKTTIGKALILALLGYGVLYLVGLLMGLVIFPMLFPALG